VIWIVSILSLLFIWDGICAQVLDVTYNLEENKPETICLFCFVYVFLCSELILILIP
jgi:hypothetical protein